MMHIKTMWLALGTAVFMTLAMIAPTHETAIPVNHLTQESPFFESSMPRVPYRPAHGTAPESRRDGGRAPGCGQYYYLSDHTTVQMTAYDKKGRPAMLLSYFISGVKDIPGGSQSKVRSELKDMNGKVVGSGEGIFKCENGRLSADMHVAMASMPMEQFKGMEVKATEAYLVYPGDMTVGSKLPDGAFHMDIYRKGKLFSQVDYNVGDREVEAAQEVITTPAGSWKCFRISYQVSIQVKMGITIPMTYKVTEWFAPGFGVVRTVNHNKKGQPVGKAELTSLN